MYFVYVFNDVLIILCFIFVFAVNNLFVVKTNKSISFNFGKSRKNYSDGKYTVT